MTAGLHYFGRTDVGLVRSHNEDTFAFYGKNAKHLDNQGTLELDEQLVAVVCDGVGGHDSGEVASALVSSSIGAAVSQWSNQVEDCESPAFAQKVDTLLKGLDKNLAQYSRQQNHERNAATTVTAAWFHDRKVTSIHVGDSRLYRLRGEEFTQLTVDDTDAGKAVAAGTLSEAEARKNPRRHVLQKAIGSGANEYRDATQTWDTKPGDVYMLCSDGLSDGLDNTQLGRALMQFQVDEANDFLTRLIEAANRASGKDNVTVSIIQIGTNWHGSSGVSTQTPHQNTLFHPMNKLSGIALGAAIVVLGILFIANYQSTGDFKREVKASFEDKKMTVESNRSDINRMNSELTNLTTLSESHGGQLRELSETGRNLRNEFTEFRDQTGKTLLEIDDRTDGLSGLVEANKEEFTQIRTEIDQAIEPIFEFLRREHSSTNLKIQELEERINDLQKRFAEEIKQSAEEDHVDQNDDNEETPDEMTD